MVYLCQQFCTFQGAITLPNCISVLAIIIQISLAHCTPFQGCRSKLSFISRVSFKLYVSLLCSIILTFFLRNSNYVHLISFAFFFFYIQLFPSLPFDSSIFLSYFGNFSYLYLRSLPVLFLMRLPILSLVIFLFLLFLCSDNLHFIFSKIFPKILFFTLRSSFILH